MSIPSTTIQYEVRKKINRINSDYAKTISVADLDAYINESKDLLYEKYAALVEINTTVRNHLIQLEKKKVPFKCVKVDDNCCFVKYPDELYRLLRQTLIATKDTCTEEREIIIRIVQSDDLSESLKDPYWKPSWSYEETIADEGSYNGDRGLFVYHNGDFIINTVYFDYLIKIPDIATPSNAVGGSYKNSAGVVINKDVDFMVDSTYLYRKVVDVAELLIKKNISEVNDWQAQLNNIMGIESLYLKP